jgi:hypothetical protein
MTDHEFLAIWELPCLSVCLAKHRLLLALKMYQHAPFKLWDCISLEDDLCDDSWLQALRHALRWFARLCPHDVPAETDWSSVEIFKWLSVATPACARVAVQKHILQECMIQEVSDGYRDLQQVCTQHGTCIDCAPVTDSQQLQRFQCSTCPASFTTPQGLSAHLWRMHQEISLERQYVFSSTCAACGKCFWTAQRLQWGRSDITGVLELVDDVDKGPIIEQAYADLAQEFPMDPLLSELDRLHRARPPVEIPLEVPASVQDPRSHRALEPLDGCFDHPNDQLSPYLDSNVLHWPRPRGVPVCRFPDGSNTMVMIHLFRVDEEKGIVTFGHRPSFRSFFQI